MIFKYPFLAYISSAGACLLEDEKKLGKPAPNPISSALKPWKLLLSEKKLLLGLSRLELTTYGLSEGYEPGATVTCDETCLLPKNLFLDQSLSVS